MNNVNNVNNMAVPEKSTGLRERVHIIPLGHEIDRAITPFRNHRADRAYVLTVPPTAELDQKMLQKQKHFTQRVCEGLTSLGVTPTLRYCNMFDILDSLRVVSSLIVMEKHQKGNDVFVNMSACGRKTSIAVTLASMVHGVQAYYVTADRYATGDAAYLEPEHGLSIVEVGKIEPLYNFRIMMPDVPSQQFLVELYRRTDGMSSKDIFNFFHQINVNGYDVPLKKMKKSDEFAPSPEHRMLLNRTNRKFLNPLENAGYIRREWRGRKFIIHLTESGKYIACISGMIEIS